MALLAQRASLAVNFSCRVDGELKSNSIVAAVRR
jgi:hypothetical protein